MLLHTIMEVFEPSFIALRLAAHPYYSYTCVSLCVYRALQFAEMIKECDDIVFPKVYSFNHSPFVNDGVLL